MKFRTDYVTNSSSSSFVCEICGRNESGFDLSLSDVDMMECINGHIFCRDEAFEIPSKKEMIAMILANEWNKKCYDWDSRQHKDYSEAELLDMDCNLLFKRFCSEDGYYGVPECVCPICQFAEYSQSDLSSYLLKEYGVSREEVFAEVKKINKRRRKLYDSEYNMYVCKKFDLNPTEIVGTWKEKFGSYNAFECWLYEKE